MAMSSDPLSIREQLSNLFAYKAEWLKERLFELFTEPSYLPELTTPRPCVLIGGRGTGKTTVLRGLSYQGQYALHGKGCDVASWSYYGFYHRINTNRVTAFQGPELREDQWIKLYGHYTNIVLCDSVLSFLEWYRLQTGDAIDLPKTVCESVAISLHLSDCADVNSLAIAIERGRVKCEAYVNNVADSEARTPLSLLGAPVDDLLRHISELPQFKGRSFFFLLDEYENLLDYQQQVFNTLVKHCGDLYTFKIGVRELGWRRRVTLNENERLVSPADYARISIPEKLEGDTFNQFALAVCKERLRRLDVPSDQIVTDIGHCLPGISEEDESLLLGVDDLVSAARSELVGVSNAVELELFDSLPPLQAYFVNYWSKSSGEGLPASLRDFRADRKTWDTRYGNYKHAMLYTIRGKKRGIQKYYAGWETFTQLAATNIRYLLELVDQSLLLHVNEGGLLSKPVAVKTQTLAAQAVGKKNLSELEGLSVHGAQLTKLLLGLGRVFGVMAAEANRHAPEVNQFHIADDRVPKVVDELLSSAVMHLALLRFPGNKAADEADTKEYDYRIHPVFAPFFVFSHRKKRRLTLNAADILGFVEEPKKAIRDVLARSHRRVDEDLPAQLTLFEKFYHGDS